MQIPPLDVILSWPAPNYTDPVTRGNALLVLTITFSILVVLAVGGRLYSRIVVKHWLGWDDGTIIVAMVFTIGLNVVVILANREYGWDRHIYDVEFGMIQKANIAAFVAKIMFILAATFTRISLICFYYRLVRDSGIDWFSRVLHVSMIMTITLGLAFMCLAVWLCVPVQSYWVFPPMENHKCLNEGKVTLIVGILNCCADLVTTALPIPLVWRLKMALRHRIGVCILLGLGMIVTIAGVLRTYYIWEGLINSWDETWYSYPLWICAAIEIDLAVICACAPALKSLMYAPLARLTSKLSSKITSKLSGFGSHTIPYPFTSADALPPGSTWATTFRTFFRKPASEDRAHSGDEEYGMLRLEALAMPEKTFAHEVHAVATHDDDAPSLPLRSPSRVSGALRPPTMEIVKSQTVQQEVTYVDQEETTSTHRIEPVEFR